MQYWRFLVMPGLKLVSRCQLAIAILMFVGSPAWIGTAGAGHRARGAYARGRSSTRLTGGRCWRHPVHVVCAKNCDRHRRTVAANAARGLWRTARLLGSVMLETLFFILLSPIQWVSHTLHLM